VGQVDLSPPFSTEVRNEWNSTPTPPHSFIVCISTPLPLLAQLSRVLPKKLRGAKLVKNFPRLLWNMMLFILYSTPPFISLLSDWNSLHTHLTCSFNNMFSFVFSPMVAGVNICLNLCVLSCKYSWLGTDRESPNTFLYNNFAELL
jgi:hypothetical protein